MPVPATSGVCLQCVDAGLASITVAFDALGLVVATYARWGCGYSTPHGLRSVLLMCILAVSRFCTRCVCEI